MIRGVHILLGRGGAGKEAGVLFEQVAVGHAGEIVANRPMQAVAGDPPGGGVAEQRGLGEVGFKNILEQTAGALVRAGHARVIVEIRVEKFLF